MKKSSGKRRSPVLTAVYHGLMAAFILLSLLFLGGTAYALFFRQKEAPPQPPPAAPVDGAGPTFTGVGRLRLATGGREPATLIISITFPYPAEDRAFSEELASRIKDFKTIAGEYFGGIGPEELRERDEGSLKKDLLERFNAVLLLGKLEVLYFSDFILLE